MTNTRSFTQNEQEINHNKLYDKFTTLFEKFRHTNFNDSIYQKNTNTILTILGEKDYNKLLRCLAAFKKTEGDNYAFDEQCFAAVKILMVNKEIFKIDPHEKPKVKSGNPPGKSAIEWAEFKENWNIFNWLKNREYRLDELKEGAQLCIGTIGQAVLWVAKDINIPGVIAAIQKQQYFQACQLLMVHIQILCFKHQENMASKPDPDHLLSTVSSDYRQKEKIVFFLMMMLDKHKELGFDINATNQNDETLMHIAAKYGQHLIYSHLEKLGISSQKENRWGFTALQIINHQSKEISIQLYTAIVQQKIDILLTILKQGVSTELYLMVNSLTLPYHEGRLMPLLNHRSTDGSTLMFALGKAPHNTALIKTLLDYGADIQMTQTHQQTLLPQDLEPASMLSCFIIGSLYYDQNAMCNLQTVELLLSKGARISERDLKAVCILIKYENKGYLKLKFSNLLTTFLQWHAGFNTDISCLKDIKEINLENCVLIGATIDGWPVSRETKNPDCSKAITDYNELKNAISTMNESTFLKFYRKMARSTNQDLKTLANTALLLHPSSLQYQAGITLFSASRSHRVEIMARGTISAQDTCRKVFSAIASIEDEKPGYGSMYRATNSPNG